MVPKHNLGLITFLYYLSKPLVLSGPFPLH